jgi:GDPmannose 4,6-dehydratase
MKKILITGPLGQDGIVLTKLLEDKFELFGVCKMLTPIQRLNEHSKNHKIKLCLSDLTNQESVDILIQTINPDIIINFAGETNVINAWDNISQTFEQNFKIPSNILTSIVKYNKDIFFFQSSSSLMFGRSDSHIISEADKYDPMYPYGISKLCAHNLLNEYRKNYNIKGCSGIFFNHESFYRSEKFITKKISKLIARIINGDIDKIKLFNLNFNRDISHAEDFMRGVEIIIENSINDDFVFSSGVSTNMLELSEKFFKLHNLNFYDYIDYNDNMNYPNEYNLIGDCTKLKSIGWEPKYSINDLILDMVDKEIKNII